MEIPGVEDLTEIGRGGMAVVYKGRQPTFSRDVAVKVVTVAGVDERLRHRFEQELQAVGALSEHPNIITVHGAGETGDGLPYLFHVPGLLGRAHGQEHQFHRILPLDPRRRGRLHARHQLRRDELRDLHLAIEQRRHAALRLLHNPEDQLIGILRFHVRPGMCGERRSGSSARDRQTHGR